LNKLSIWKPTVCWNTRLDTKPYMLSINCWSAFESYPTHSDFQSWLEAWPPNFLAHPYTSDRWRRILKWMDITDSLSKVRFTSWSWPLLTIPLFWFFFPLPSWPIRHCLYNEAEIKCSRRTIFPFVSGGAPVCMKLRHLQIFHKSTRKEAQLLSIWKPTVCWNTRLDTKPYMLSITVTYGPRGQWEKKSEKRNC
jgi:hypothetical protein